MALFQVSHPPWLRLVGVRTSYIYFSNISWTPWVLDPVTNPFLGPSSWLHPASQGVGEILKAITGWRVMGHLCFLIGLPQRKGNLLSSWPVVIWPHTAKAPLTFGSCPLRNWEGSISSSLFIVVQMGHSQVLEEDPPRFWSHQEAFKKDLHVKGTEKEFAITRVLA